MIKFDEPYDYSDLTKSGYRNIEDHYSATYSYNYGETGSSKSILKRSSKKFIFMQPNGCYDMNVRRDRYLHVLFSYESKSGISADLYVSHEKDGSRECSPSFEEYLTFKKLLDNFVGNELGRP